MKRKRSCEALFLVVVIIFACLQKVHLVEAAEIEPLPGLTINGSNYSLSQVYHVKSNAYVTLGSGEKVKVGEIDSWLVKATGTQKRDNRYVPCALLVRQIVNPCKEYSSSLKTELQGRIKTAGMNYVKLTDHNEMGWMPLANAPSGSSSSSVEMSLGLGISTGAYAVGTISTGHQGLYNRNAVNTSSSLNGKTRELRYEFDCNSWMTVGATQDQFYSLSNQYCQSSYIALYVSSYWVDTQRYKTTEDVSKRISVMATFLVAGRTVKATKYSSFGLSMY
ncbi:MAG: hypothetical protein II483_02695 [Lachnospiraceae bacterium]|nr:hypothetical protein [Lachnospiraceae bacterium]